MESMTGYGRSAAEAEGLRVTAEIRGVNHKGLDIHFYLPSPLLRHEIGGRRAIRERVARGHLDVRVNLELLGEEAVEVQCSEGVAKAVGHLAQRLSTQGVLARGMTLGDMLALPGALQVGLNPRLEQDAGRLLLEALNGALEAFVLSRTEEGRRLEGQFRRGEETLGGCLAGLAPLLPAQIDSARQKLQARIVQLGVVVEQGRIEQEVALAAERADVAEEFERLQSHRAALGALIKKPGLDQGKRLDHLLQEMQREISTLLAKAGLMDITKIGLDMRLLVEQLREQAQNVA